MTKPPSSSGTTERKKPTRSAISTTWGDSGRTFQVSGSKFKVSLHTFAIPCASCAHKNHIDRVELGNWNLDLETRNVELPSMRFLPYAQLLRLPNVFTAFADALLGTLATAAWVVQPAGSALLLLASGCLYCSGMVWNDYFDFAEDKRDRPFRPLPSGKISRRTSAWLAAGLLLAGCAFAALAGIGPSWNFRPALIAGILVTAILFYDAWLKR